MKREILFKGIVIDESTIFFGEWFYGDLIQYVDGTVYIRQVQTNSMLQVDPETVCQFTGLLDKNGNKIFEGDIVDAWNQGSHLTNGIIRWGIGTCKFFIGNESNSIVWNLCGVGKNHNQEDLEIIGNVHD